MTYSCDLTSLVLNDLTFVLFVSKAVLCAAGTLLHVLFSVLFNASLCHFSPVLQMDLLGCTEQPKRATSSGGVGREMFLGLSGHTSCWFTEVGQKCRRQKFQGIVSKSGLSPQHFPWLIVKLETFPILSPHCHLGLKTKYIQKYHISMFPILRLTSGDVECVKTCVNNCNIIGENVLCSSLGIQRVVIHNSNTGNMRIIVDFNVNVAQSIKIVIL